MEDADVTSAAMHKFFSLPHEAVLAIITMEGLLKPIPKLALVAVCCAKANVAVTALEPVRPHKTAPATSHCVSYIVPVTGGSGAGSVVVADEAANVLLAALHPYLHLSPVVDA